MAVAAVQSVLLGWCSYNTLKMAESFKSGTSSYGCGEAPLSKALLAPLASWVV